MFGLFDFLGRLIVAIARDYRTVTATIANGASLSGEVDLGGAAILGIHMPAAWTAAVLTFQAAPASGGTFADVYDDLGNEVTLTVDTSRAVGVDLKSGALAPYRFIKIRSGTSAAAVAQGAERALTLSLKG